MGTEMQNFDIFTPTRLSFRLITMYCLKLKSMQLTHTMFIHLFIPIKKPTSRILLQVVGYQLWAQLGSNLDSSL